MHKNGGQSHLFAKVKEEKEELDYIPAHDF